MWVSVLEERTCTVAVDSLVEDASCSKVRHTEAVATSHVEPQKCWLPVPPLEGVKSKKRPVIWFYLKSGAGAEGKGVLPVRSLSLSGRAVFHSLSPQEAAALLDNLTNEGVAEDSVEMHQWMVHRHASLKVMVLPEADEDPWSTIAANMPHVLVVHASSFLKESSSFRTALVTFPGALLVIAEELTPDLEELLSELAISERWPCPNVHCRRPSPPALEPFAEDHQGPIFLHDVLVRGPSSPEHYPKPWLPELMEDQLAPLYLDEFGADLGNLRQSQHGYGIKLTLMLKERVADEVPELLGFLAYKSWGGPMPCVSVCAVGVPSRFRGCGYGRALMQVAEAEAARVGEPRAPGVVRFRSLATAVGFYSRLGYHRTDEDAETEGTQESVPTGSQDSDEDAPCVPMERFCAPAGSAPPSAPRSPLQAWSPRRARHLEDGPTWLPADAFELPEAAA